MRLIWLSVLAAQLLACSQHSEPVDAGSTELQWHKVSIPWPGAQSIVVATIDGEVRLFASVYNEQTELTDIVSAKWSKNLSFIEGATVVSLDSASIPRLSWSGALKIEYYENEPGQSNVLVFDPRWMISPVEIIRTRYSSAPAVLIGAVDTDRLWALRNTPYQNEGFGYCQTRTPELFSVVTPGVSSGPLCPFESGAVDPAVSGAPIDSFDRSVALHSSQRVFSRGGCDFGLFELDGGLTACVDAGLDPLAARFLWSATNETAVSLLSSAGVWCDNDSFTIKYLHHILSDGGVTELESPLSMNAAVFGPILPTSKGVAIFGARFGEADDAGCFQSRAAREWVIFVVSNDGSQILYSPKVSQEASAFTITEDNDGVALWGSRAASNNVWDGEEVFVSDLLPLR